MRQARPRALKCAVYAPALSHDLDAWLASLAQLDTSGLTALSVSDHFSYGSMDPVAALAAIAAATSRVRVMALLFCNDYRHPVITHKAAATLDVLSGGRFDFGIGAGFLEAEYRAAGLDYDEPGVRVDRLGEALEVLTALFAGTPVDHAGEHYRIEGLTGIPAPVQRPHPPLVVGGGSRRMLGLAGRYADIVGVHSNLRAGTSYNAGVIEDLLPEHADTKVAWARTAAEEAGRDPDALDYLYITWTCRVVSREAERPAALRQVAERYGVTEEVADRSVGLLVGTVDQCMEQILERRDRYGLNYVDFGVADMDMLAPLVDAMTGERSDA